MANAARDDEPVPQAPVQEAPNLIGLRSTHLVIDTSIYVKDGTNLRSPLFERLREACRELGLSVHMNAVILHEVEKQLREAAAGFATTTSRYLKALETWGERTSPRGSRRINPEPPALLDPESEGDRAYGHFIDQLMSDFNMLTDDVGEVELLPILGAYFEKKPPFAKTGSKEFPDAIILDVTRRFAERTGKEIYLITADAELTQACALTPGIIALGSIDEFLEIIEKLRHHGVTEFVDVVLERESVLLAVMEKLKASVPNTTFIYTGTDLNDGFVREVILGSSNTFENFSVIRLQNDELTLSGTVRSSLQASVGYTSAIEWEMMKQDHIWYAIRVPLRVIFTVNVVTLEVTYAEIINPVVFIRDPLGFSKALHHPSLSS